MQGIDEHHKTLDTANRTTTNKFLSKDVSATQLQSGFIDLVGSPTSLYNKQVTVDSLQAVSIDQIQGYKSTDIDSHNDQLGLASNDITSLFQEARGARNKNMV